MKRLLLIAAVFVPAGLFYLVGGTEFVERGWMDARFALAQRPAASDVVLVEIDPRSLRLLDHWPWPRAYHASALEQLLDAGARRVGFDVDFGSPSIPDDELRLRQAVQDSGGRVVLPQFDSVQPLPEFDGLVRRYSAHPDAEQRLQPSFAAALADDPELVAHDFYIDFGIDLNSIPRLSFVDVLVGRFDPAQVEGKTVIIGATAIELGDQLAVPVFTSLAGPVLQALAYESLTQNRALVRAGPLGVLALLLLVVALLGPAYESTNWRVGLLFTLALGLGTLGISLTLQRLLPVIVDTAPFLLAFVGLYGQSLMRRIDQRRFRQLMQRLMLSRSEHLMHHVIENSFDAIVTVGPDDLVEALNATARRMFGHADAEIIGRNVAQLFPATVAGEAAHPLSGATGHPVECLVKRRDGSVLPVELVVAEVDAGANRRRVAFLRDITERKSQQQILEHQATHDPLTDLPNRSLLSEKTREAIGRHSHEGRGLAMLMLDLARFKEVNDALGHRVGDRLLQKIARRLTCPLDERALLSRLGGDEFAILLSECDAEQAVATALRLVEAFKTPFEIDDVSLQIDTSIGIALFPEHAGDEETLIRLADVAMYAAKRRRTSFVIYEPESDPNSLRHLTLRADLRRAIEHNELELAYQPKVDSRNLAIVGVEALLRWNHPQHGPISPEEFIGLAERTGLIRSLTQWVCRTAVAQCAEWNRLGMPLGMSLNLSARNLLEEDLPETLQRILTLWDVPASQLTLEITESVIMDDPERALHVVTQLRDLGVGISIDDFGTGYSSLGYLAQLPAQELKIDRSFVMRMERDAGNSVIVHSTISLAHNLDMTVVAEGVETEAVWEALRILGCDFCQGYHFSKPLPAEELLGFVRARGSFSSAELPLEQPDAAVPVPPVPSLSC